MLSFLAIAGITAVYLLVVLVVGIPGASDLFGHSLGILGFTLMLATETLYTLRKRIGNSAWGRPSSWLKFHIFTGLVGPYLVFLHSAWDFGGLAGLTMLLTGIVVLSGFVGRYLYTFLPRSAEGVLLEENEILARIQAAEQELQAHSQGRSQAPEPVLAHSQVGTLAANPVNVSTSWLTKLKLAPDAKKRQAEIDRLYRRKRKLERQITTLATARRLFALWHTLHIPLGMAMFAMAFIHIGAALYYATLLR
jgi:hypothetical protein